MASTLAFPLRKPVRLRVQALVALVLAMLCFAAAPASARTGWTQFRAADGSFTASTPTRPVQKEKGPKTYLWTAGSKKAIYLFGYTPLAGLGKHPMSDQKKALRAFTDQFCKSAKITEKGRKNIARGSDPGIEVTGTMLQMPTDARILCIGKSDRIYILVAIGGTDKAKFFRGFKIK